MITRNQLNAWAGFTLTDEQVARIAESLPHSTMPEVVATIADDFRPDDDDTCEECGEDIPGVDGGSLANKHHAPGCSLYDSTAN
jgi:hypothetical protein